MNFIKSWIRYGYANFRLKSKTLLKPILFSYILVLLLPVVFNILVITNGRHLVISELINYNDIIVSQLSDILDEDLTMSRSVISYISANKKIMNTVNAIKGYNRSDVKEYSAVSAELRSCFTQFSSIEQVYLYFKEYDLVISSTSPMKKSLAYDAIHKSPDFTFDSWDNLMMNTYKQDIISMPGTDENSGVAFLSPLPHHNGVETSVIVVIMLNKSKISKTTEYLKNNLGDNVVISAFYNDRMFYSNDSDFVGNAETGKKDELHEGVSYDNINSQQYIVINKFSSIGDQIRYTAYVPYKEILGKSMKRIVTLVFLSILLIIILGAMIITYFTRRIYSPIKHIAVIMSKKVGNQKNRDDDELTYIQNTTDLMNTQLRYLDNALKKQNNLLKNHFLRSLLYGRIKEETEINEQLAQYNVNIGDKCMVAVLNISDYARLFEGDYDSSLDQKLDCLFFVFENVLSDLLGGKTDFEVVMLNDFRYAIIFSPTSSEVATHEKIDEKLRYAQSFIGENLYVIYTYRISETYPSEQISDAFFEAMSQFDDMPQRSSGGNHLADYTLSADSEAILVNYIKTGNYAGAEQIISGFWNSLRIVGVDMEMYAKYSLLNSMMKGLSPSKQTLFYEKVHPLERLAKCATVKDAEQTFIDFVGELKHFADTDIKDRAYELCNSILEYIDENYSNPDLNVAMLGEHFALTAHYLSGIFKQNIGENLKSYINQYRVNKSKVMLRRGNESVRDIAMTHGFTDSNTYIRVFKQYTGVTPGQYRNIADSDKN